MRRAWLKGLWVDFSLNFVLAIKYNNLSWLMYTFWTMYMITYLWTQVCHRKAHHMDKQHYNEYWNKKTSFFTRFMHEDKKIVASCVLFSVNSVQSFESYACSHLCATNCGWRIFSGRYQYALMILLLTCKLHRSIITVFTQCLAVLQIKITGKKCFVLSSIEYNHVAKKTYIVSSHCLGNYATAWLPL